MFARKLLSHLETHADQLSEGLLKKIIRSADCTELLQRVPENEQKQTMQDIYGHLMGWLQKDIRSVDQGYYIRLGRRRAEQGVPFSEVLSAVCAARQYFWDYVSQETLLDQPSDFWGSIRLLYSLDCCFDSALRLVSIGYEQAYEERLTHRIAGKTANV